LSYLPGRKIEQAQLYSGHTIKHPAAQKFCLGLAGCTFESIDRRGKYLLFQMVGGKSLIVHLGMSGRLLFNESVSELSHVRMNIALTAEAKGKRTASNSLYLQDPRRFSRVWLADAPAKLFAAVPSLSRLGVEPLSKDLNQEYLLNQFSNRKQSIKAVLLDQTVIAGIGNIYADESLFVARIHPLTSAQRLTSVQVKCLIDAVRKVLSRAIERGGSSLRNYSDISGVNGNYQHRAWVYGRSGKPCRVCKTPIQRVVVMARSTHFCPHCQQASKSKLYGF
jgi:formamidopyrimidine-DNA glycosylase